MPEFDELFFSKESRDKKAEFKKEMDAIEEKYKDFFKDKESIFKDSRPRAELNEFYATYEADGQIRFWFTDDSLPQQIKDECIAAFKKVYQ